MKKNFLEVAVFICGASTMMIELVGSRVLAPHVGTSILVWTSLIGIILGFLSLGYAWGGKFADKNPRPEILSRIIFFAAVWAAAIAFAADFVVMGVGYFTWDLRITAIISTIFLFGVPSVLLGMVSPFAARIRTTEVQHAGATVGMLYAISTIGSIVGTFLAGFYLVSYFSNTIIFLVIASLLVLASGLVFTGKKGTVKRALVIALFAVLGSQSGAFAQSLFGSDFIDVNTPYNRVWIYDMPVADPENAMRMMQINDETSSMMYIYKEGLAAPYCRYYRLAAGLHPGLKKALLIGGGAFTFPRDFIEKNPGASIDVVEIDPKLKELAKEHFRLKDDPRLRIFDEDARPFLNGTKEKYDAVFIDCFRSFSPPFQLTTQESLAAVSNVLTDDGIVMANVISSVTGDRGRILRGLLAGFKANFQHVYVMAVFDGKDGDITQNLMIMAFKSKKAPKLFTTNPELNSYLQRIWIDPIPEDVPALRDHFAPVDRYEIPVLEDMLKIRRNEMLYRLKRRFHAV